LEDFRVSKFVSVEGIVTSIEPIQTGRNRQNNCCVLMISVRNENRGVTNFIVDNDTYFIDNVTVAKGDRITAFYDSSLMVPLIYPPQYRAVVVAKQARNRSVKVDSFDRNLVSSDGSLKLNIAPSTKIRMRNNQYYLCDIVGKNVAVVYSATTRSYPAITTPSEIIVLCA